MIGGMVGRPSGSQQDRPLMIVKIRGLRAFTQAHGLALPFSGDGKGARRGNV